MLNQGYIPHSVIRWQDAIDLWYKDKAEIVDSYIDKHCRSEKIKMFRPLVIRLLHFVTPGKKFSAYKKYSRIGAYYRDNGKCQYCNIHVSKNKFEIDHIVPESKGGKTNFLNCVTACHKCNHSKGDRTLEEWGRKLLNKPYTPLIANDFFTFTRQKLANVKKSILERIPREYLQRY